jgi:hypothetical protein
MPKRIERLSSAGKETKPYFAAGFGAIFGGAGLTGAGAIGGVAGAAALAAAPVVIATGGVVVAGAAAYCGYRWMFAKKRESYHDKPVKLNDLNHEYWSCHIYRIAVVGIKRAGKTEIKAKLRNKLAGDRDTESIETHIFELDAKNKIFVALLDGRGADSDERRQQFAIAERSEVLLVVVDHNESDKLSTISDTRLEDHKSFLEELFKHLGHKRRDNKLEKIFFLLNKKDGWEVDGRANHLKNWFNDRIQEAKKAGISLAEERMEISAFKLSDIETLKTAIKLATKEASER